MLKWRKKFSKNFSKNSEIKSKFFSFLFVSEKKTKKINARDMLQGILCPMYISA